MIVPKTAFLNNIHHISGAVSLNRKLPAVLNPLESDATSMIGTFLNSIRGGGGTASSNLAFDLGRARIRLEGLQMYCTIASLIMNAALDLYSSTPKNQKEDPKKLLDRVENWVKILFACNTIATVVMGSYSCIVFVLLGLYSKTALGMGLDDKFLQFFQETHYIRESAFHTFIWGLLSFQGSFICSLFLNYSGWMRWFVLAISSIASLFSIYKWNEILSIAGKILYS